jgi:hypothetical protein
LNARRRQLRRKFEIAVSPPDDTLWRTFEAASQQHTRRICVRAVFARRHRPPSPYRDVYESRPSSGSSGSAARRLQVELRCYLMQETHMFSGKLAAAAAVGLCLTWGSAYAGPEMLEDSQPQAAAPADVPEGVGATNDVIILELAPAQGGEAAGAEDNAAMQMLLLQLLMMQAQMEGGAGAEAQMSAPTPGMVGI